MKTNNDIDIVLIIDNSPYTLTVEKTAPTSQLINAIFESFKLNPKFNEITFQNKPLKSSDNRQLVTLIQNKNNSIFYINKKSILTSVGNNLINSNNQISKKSLNKNPLSQSMNNKRPYKLNPNIQEENNFIKKKNTMNNPNQNRNIFNEYNIVKTNTPNIEKLKISKFHHNKHYSMGNNILSSSRKTRNRNNDLMKDYFSQDNFSLRNKPKNFSLGELEPYLTKESSKIINDFYSNQQFVRNSSPYISEHEQRKIEEKENKKKFLNKKGFFVSVGKYSMKPNYIQNYVQMTPSESPLNFKFRMENKNKWITKKGFINA